MEEIQGEEIEKQKQKWRYREQMIEINILLSQALHTKNGFHGDRLIITCRIGPNYRFTGGMFRKYAMCHMPGPFLRKNSLLRNSRCKIQISHSRL